MSRFNLRDRVRKRYGFKFPGVVVAIFRTTAGAERIVVEADHPEFAGMLHIYRPDQIEVVESAAKTQGE